MQTTKDLSCAICGTDISKNWMSYAPEGRHVVAVCHEERGKEVQCLERAGVSGAEALGKYVECVQQIKDLVAMLPEYSREEAQAMATDNGPTPSTAEDMDAGDKALDYYFAMDALQAFRGAWSIRARAVLEFRQA